MTARMAPTRREAIKVAAAGVSTLAAVSVVGSTEAPRASRVAPSDADWRRIPDEARAAEVRTFLGPLVVGTQLGPYAIAQIDPMDRGGIPISLTGPTGEFAVDVLRHDPHGPAGVGTASAVSVFVRNRGNGATATDEHVGLGAMALAAALAERVRAGAVPPADMQTMSERSAASSLA
jgi:hypothetical protein